jgi:hypothetical protein
MRFPEIFIIAGCVFLSFAAGWMFSDWFRPKPRCPDCPMVSYEQIGRIVEKAVKTNAVQGFDVEKIKNVRGFTYAPQSIYQVQMCQDTLLLRRFVEQITTQTHPAPPKEKGLFR